jgi:excisionase family DNA binding protein
VTARRPAGSGLAPKLLSTKEAAERLGVSTNTVNTMAANRELPYVNIAERGQPRLRFDEEDVAALAERRARMLSTRQVAERLSVSRSFVLRMIASGALPVDHRTGKSRIKVDEKDLAAFIDARSHQAPRHGRTHLWVAS